ncbi:MAG: DUF4296 domain-containing protein [Flavobacteriales bacterium]
MNNLFLIAIFLLFSCSNPNENNNQDNFLNKEKLKTVLVEKHLLLAKIKSFQYDDSLSISKMDSLINQLCEDNGTSLSEFQKSWDYYMNNEPKILSSIYDEVIQELKTKEVNQ